MSFCLLMLPGIRSSLMFSSFGVKPSASGFQSYSYHSLKAYQPYSTDDKTSRLMVKKILHSEGHPDRFTELHGEEKRVPRDTGDQEEKRGSQKGREESSQ